MSTRSSSRTLSRRQILRGAGGAVLALPLLRSLLDEKTARASYTTRKFFVSMQTEHGAAWGKHMFPADSTLTDKLTYAGHEIRGGALVATQSGGKAAICPILSADATKLTDRIVSKMNVIRGVDVTMNVGHNSGVALGNYARNDADANGPVADQPYIPTIDQIMAWSPNFYADLSTIRERTLVVGDRISWDYSNPQTRSGPVQAIAPTYDSNELLKRVFVTNDPNARKPIVDLVLADYKRLRGASGLSKEDARRLDDHMQRVAELQRRLNVRATCSAVAPPKGNSTTYMYQPSYGVDANLETSAWQLINDVIVAAFMCGTSRIAALRPAVYFSNYTGDWHQEVAHQAHLPDGLKQGILRDGYQTFFETIFLDLVTKLDAVDDGTGRTLLDDALVVWNQEAGAYTHEPVSLPIVAAGGAGGFLKTGRYSDYRNLYMQVNKGGYQGSTEITHAGLHHAQWLGTVLRAMGLEPSEYESGGVGGYGLNNVDPQRAASYPPAIFAARKDILPFLT